MSHLRRLVIVGAALVVVVLIATLVPAALNPAPPSEEKRRRDSQWISSSPYWLDRQACRFFGVCGVMHLRWDPPYVPPGTVPFDDEDGGWVPRLELRRRSWEEVPRLDVDEDQIQVEEAENGDATTRRRTKSERTKSESRRKVALKDIPSYVLEHAPLVHLFSEEHFWPADIMEHVRHLSPFYENEPVNSTIDLSNLHKLNSKAGLVSLRSDEDVEGRPDWLYSEAGIPVPFKEPLTEDDLLEPPAKAPKGRHQDSTWHDVNRDVPLHHISDPTNRPGRRPPARNSQPFSTTEAPEQPPSESDDGHNSTYEGYSSAPAVLIMVEKAPGIIDAYWFFFYSYNLGQTVARLRFGNHVGDWEHCMIRFEDGVPRAVFLSEHEGGQAFEFAAMSRYRRFPKRPVIFSAVGSHAMYALPGKHAYVLPFGMLADETDRGPLWDPAKNTYAYHYDYQDDDDRHGGEAFLENGDEDDDDANEVGNEDVDAAAANDPSKTAVDMKMHDPDSATSDDQIVIGQPGRGRKATRPNKSLSPAASNPDAPTSWFHFTGVWGDALYPLADTRQWRLFMQYHYVTGPRGPKDKNLDREKMCPRSQCRLLDHLDPKGKWY